MEAPRRKTAKISRLERKVFLKKMILRGRPFNSWRGEGGGGRGDFDKNFPAGACRKKKIACSTNVIESLWEKKGKKYLVHQIARKNSWWPEITNRPPPHPSRVQWSAPKLPLKPLIWYPHFRNLKGYKLFYYKVKKAGFVSDIEFVCTISVIRNSDFLFWLHIWMKSTVKL